MAQLPPKIPNMAPNWPDFSSHQKIPSLTSMTPNNVATTNSNANNSNNSHQNQSWVDEFFDFSSSRRGAHRRSVSDSITFIETPMLEDCRGNSGAVPPRSGGDNNEFDRFDDDQFMSMFTDDISGNPMPPTISSSNPSSPSDHNSINDDKETTLLQPTEKLNKKEVELQKQVKNESDEVESQDELDTQAPNNTNNNNNAPSSADKITDPKRVKRILANRQSAQRSRVRKLQYISELERSVTSLQAEVSVLSPRVAYLDHQRLLLNVDNSALKQRIAALQQDKLFKDAHQEALRKEIERLRQVYHHQSLKKMENIAAGPPSPSPSPSPNTESGANTEKEKLIDV